MDGTVQAFYVHQVLNLRDALEKIRDYPVNGNSDPEVMAHAVGEIKRIAHRALEIKWPVA